MEDLRNLLKAQQPQEPPQIQFIKDYIKSNFSSQCSVTKTNDSYIVSVPDGTVASYLRMSSPDIEKLCGLDKKLIIRIGS
jgi:hypothetical protein